MCVGFSDCGCEGVIGDGDYESVIGEGDYESVIGEGMSVWMGLVRVTVRV